MRGARVGDPPPGRLPALLLVPHVPRRGAPVTPGAGAPGGPQCGDVAPGVPAGVHSWPVELVPFLVGQIEGPASAPGAEVVQLLGRRGGGRPVPALVPVPMRGADGVLVEPVAGGELVAIPRWRVVVRDLPRGRDGGGRRSRGAINTFWLGALDVAGSGAVKRWVLWVEPDPTLPFPPGDPADARGEG